MAVAVRTGHCQALAFILDSQRSQGSTAVLTCHCPSTPWPEIKYKLSSNTWTLPGLIAICHPVGCLGIFDQLSLWGGVFDLINCSTNAQCQLLISLPAFPARVQMTQAWPGRARGHRLKKELGQKCLGLPTSLWCSWCRFPFPWWQQKFAYQIPCASGRIWIVWRKKQKNVSYDFWAESYYLPTQESYVFPSGLSEFLFYLK